MFSQTSYIIVQLLAVGASPLVANHATNQTWILPRQDTSPIARTAWPKLWFYRGKQIPAIRVHGKSM